MPRTPPRSRTRSRLRTPAAVRASSLALLAAAALVPPASLGLAGCGPSSGANAPNRSPLATQWLERSKVSYRAGDFDDAKDAAAHALAAAPNDPEIREVAARVSLVRLDFADVLKLTEGLTTSGARGLRGRAYWFSGDVEHAADELEAQLADPQVKDPWAQDVAGLARRGVGRHPFEMQGGIVASVEMPRSIDRVPLGAANVVPCELDGERILALVATGSSEVLLDSNSRREPAWVSLRFDRVEFDDVPALVQDLSPISRQVGVPIKALIGSQLLRHGHATLDRRGDQFVVRRDDASAPPDANRVPLYYVRGGGMMLRATVTSRNDGPLPLLVDSSRPFPLLLQDEAWKKAGVDLSSLVTIPDEPTIKRGVVPVFRLAGFDLAKMPAIEGADFAQMTNGLDIDLAGVVGADMLSFFRMTFADEGRFMWIEPDPMLLGPEPDNRPKPAPAGAPPPPAASSAAPPLSTR
jgi:hypothetical protein